MMAVYGMTLDDVGRLTMVQFQAFSEHAEKLLKARAF